ncbi:biotin--[acetyl-CoA-carboxylase] ligase [Antarcticibacterium arcticum]|uniref:Biotin--[acetyl-CoA-carboxylase] ligase n=1 Tax=Antarcticibacterium arcticum TaxID=2585771 RepID=A0A5B8YIS5_9FLAO|nr:biotin--[acetyl-CoA-carboxylase] ligase [Antarcticibacterium arcticum]QED36296.1 biotin--[acetyl-CoA-carboxylase] ligase [Antarcticibacterium arcticum]
MHIIKVSATESTNTLSREWYHSNKNSAPFCIVAFEQTSGRGQRGAGWVSNAGENLTMSVVYPHPAIEIQDQFVLSAMVGITIMEVLRDLKINHLKLKWPNDIMAANFKVGGILIENILNNGRIAASIIGIGLNINQLIFPLLPKAASLKSISGKDYDIEKLLKVILNKLDENLKSLELTPSEEVLRNYENYLFRRNKVSTFQLASQEFLTGIIRGVTSTGLLKVEVEDVDIRLFDLKELKLLF